MKRDFYIFLLVGVTVGAVSILKLDESSKSDQPGELRKSKLLYNFWVSLPGVPTLPPGCSTPCNVSTLITTPCSCGGPTCEIGRTCIDPGTTMTCTTPTICTDMVISTAVACTCGTGAAAEVCTVGEFCNANAAMNRCTRLPDCLATGRYSMAMPCRCGLSTNVCGLGLPADMGVACTIGTGECRMPTPCTDGGAGTPVNNAPCLCSTDPNLVICPVTGICGGQLPANRCLVPVAPLQIAG